jgi:hypothetical protein
VKKDAEIMHVILNTDRKDRGHTTGNLSLNYFLDFPTQHAMEIK